MNKAMLPKAFLLILIGAVITACYLVFKPFLIEIIAATILVSIFYKPYEWLTVKLKGRKNIASFLMCLAILILVIFPLVNLLVYGAQQSVDAYSKTINYLNQSGANEIAKSKILEQANIMGMDTEGVKNLILEVARKSSNLFVSGATSFVKGTTSLLISLLLIILTMFFFFVDGKVMLEKIMYWTPLPNKYDREIFKKFRDVSVSTMLSTFVTALAQGVIGGIGFMIVGLPAFFPAVFMALLSLLPYIGAAMIWFPTAIYLLIIGKIWQGIVLLIWGGVAVSSIDNILRAYLMKSKVQIHPIFIIFSILGGITLFGFWGLFIGPLIISLTVTVLHIYELEYGEVLEK